MPSATDFGTILGKRALGKASARPANPFYEEPQASKIITVAGNVWTEADLIPSTAPTLVDQEESGVVKRWIDLQLTPVAGSSQAFTNTALLNAIPFYWGTGGTYNYVIKANGSTVAFGQNDWYLLDGVLTFNSGMSGLSAPITISFYEYVGRTLVQSLSESGKFQQTIDTWDVDTGSVPVLEFAGNYSLEAFSADDDTAVYTTITLGPNYKYIKPLILKVTYRMSVNAAADVKLVLGYEMRTDDGFSTTINFTDVIETITTSNDGNFHSTLLTIPIQLQDYELVNLKFARLGSDPADTHTGSFQVLSTILYQE